MQPLEIKKGIYWVGAVDYVNRDFHGYALSPQGTTYNAYVLLDEKNVLLTRSGTAFQKSCWSVCPTSSLRKKSTIL